MNYYNSANAEVLWNEELKAAVIVWKGFAYGDELQTILLKGIELLEQKKCKKLLMDDRNGSAIKVQDQDWVAHTFVSKAYAAGLRFFAMVLPKSMVAKLSIDRTSKSLGDIPYEFVNFNEMEEAVKWIANPH